MSDADCFRSWWNGRRWRWCLRSCLRICLFECWCLKVVWVCDCAVFEMLFEKLFDFDCVGVWEVVWVCNCVGVWEVVWVCDCFGVWDVVWEAWVCDCVGVWEVVWVCDCFGVWEVVWVCDCVGVWEAVWVCECWCLRSCLSLWLFWCLRSCLSLWLFWCLRCCLRSCLSCDCVGVWEVVWVCDCFGVWEVVWVCDCFEMLFDCVGVWEVVWVCVLAFEKSFEFVTVLVFEMLFEKLFEFVTVLVFEWQSDWQKHNYNHHHHQVAPPLHLSVVSCTVTCLKYFLPILDQWLRHCCHMSQQEAHHQDWLHASRHRQHRIAPSESQHIQNLNTFFFIHLVTSWFCASCSSCWHTRRSCSCSHTSCVPADPSSSHLPTTTGPNWSPVLSGLEHDVWIVMSCEPHKRQKKKEQCEEKGKLENTDEFDQKKKKKNKNKPSWLRQRKRVLNQHWVCLHWKEWKCHQQQTVQRL